VLVLCGQEKESQIVKPEAHLPANAESLAAAQTPEPKTLIYTYIQGFGRGGLGYYTPPSVILKQNEFLARFTQAT
jgi:hypothetical protein